MTRKIWMLAVTMMVLAALTGSALATVPHSPLTAQDQAEDDDEAPAAPPIETLVLGEQFVGPGWNLEVRDAFVVESPRRPGYSAVRASVVFQPMTNAGQAYGIFSLTGLDGYPALVIRDAMGAVHEIPGARPGEHLVPGSALLSTAPEVPARWTVGFEVPTQFADQLSVEAVSDGFTLASWDLDSSATEGTVYGSPDGLAVAAPGDGIRWNEDVHIVATDHTMLSCGSDDGHKTVSFALEVEVTNESEFNAYFPDVRFPETPAIAVWADGASARYSDEGGLADEAVPLADRNEEQTIVPPGVTATRVLEFFVPRDTRLSDEDAAPAGVIFTPPGGGAIWLDLAGAVDSGDLFRVDGCDMIDGGPAFTVDQTGILIDLRHGPVEPTSDTDPTDDNV